jgi:hypothetical protein
MLDAAAKVGQNRAEAVFVNASSGAALARG